MKQYGIVSNMSLDIIDNVVIYKFFFPFHLLKMQCTIFRQINKHTRFISYFYSIFFFKI